MKTQVRNRLYPFLAFDPGVDWQHVNPQLLQALNRMAARKGVIVDINSGYRTPAHSVAVGGFADDPHTQGIAVDGYVDGKPVGAVFTAGEFKAAGLITGNQPGFFNGKPDPEHVQLPATDTATPTTPPTDVSTTASAPTPDPSATNPVLPPTAPTTTGVSAQPTVAAPEPVAGSIADLWRQVTSLPQVSPETLQLANNSQQAGG